MKFFNQLTAMFMVVLVMFNVVACGASPVSGSTTLTSTPVPVTDAAVQAVDVALLGLPSDAGQVTDASADAPIQLITTGGANGEVILPLAQSARAPFNGVLFNGPAVAFLTVEFQGQQQRCQIDRQHDIAMYAARYTRDIDSMHLALRTQQQMDQVLLTNRNLDVGRLNQVIQNQQHASSGPHFLEGLVWAGGGLLLGSLLVGGIVLFANSVH